MAFRFPQNLDGVKCLRVGHFSQLYPPEEKCFHPEKWYDLITDDYTIYDYEGHPNGGFDGWTHLTCPARCRCRCCGRRDFSHKDPLIVSLAGVCENPSSSSSRCAVGVWFGDRGEKSGSSNNISKITTDTTKDQADISAAIVALDQYDKLVKSRDRDRDRTIILKSSSEFLVKGITEHIFKWKERDWKNAVKKPVQNRDLWEKLDESIMKAKQRGTRVLFWQVPRDWNSLAASLAVDAFATAAPQTYPAYDRAIADYIKGRDTWMQDYKDECKRLGYVKSGRH